MLDEKRMKEIDTASKELKMRQVFPEINDVDILEKYFEMNDRDRILCLESGDVFNICVDLPETENMFKKYKEGFKDIVRQSILRILFKKYIGTFTPEHIMSGVRIVLESNRLIKLQNIDPRIHEGTPVSFDCTVLLVDRRKSYIEKARFGCPICFDTTDIRCNDNREILIPLCVNPKCKRQKMVIDTNNIVTNYIQTVVIQEPVEDAKNNSPVSFTGKIKGDYVGEVFVGQKKRVLGMLKSQVDLSKKENELVIDIIDVMDLQEVQLIKPTEDELLKWKESSKKDDFMDKLIDSYAPHIHGHRDVKKSILLQLAGGVHTKKRGDINIFLVGDPSMAKTELLKFGKLVTQKSIYTNGRGSSGAGLTIGMVKFEDRMMAQAGVYPLCHNGCVFVDEFDKMTREDRSAMHEVLEQGTCSIAKAGINLTLPAKVATLAAANPKYGKYDTKLTLLDNIDLPPTILSRFDLIWLILDKIDDVVDTKKAEHVLSSFDDNFFSGTPYSIKQLTSYFNYIKELKPVLTKEVRAEILKIYKNMRELNKKNMEDCIPIGIRQLEAIVRLCMAHAKIYMKKDVDLIDVGKVVDLFKSSFMSFNKNLDTGQTTQGGIFTSTREGREHEFWVVWEECKDGDGCVSIEQFYLKLGSIAGWTGSKVKSLWHEFIVEGLIYEHINGKYKKS